MSGEVEAPWRTYVHLWQALLRGPAAEVMAVTFFQCCSICQLCQLVGRKQICRPALLAEGKSVAFLQGAQLWRQGLYDALLQAVMSAADSLNLSYHPARPQHQVPSRPDQPRA